VGFYWLVFWKVERKKMTREEMRIVFQIIVLFVGIISSIAALAFFISGEFIYSSFSFGLCIGIWLSSNAFRIG